jgi:hypothetical protein
MKKQTKIILALIVFLGFGLRIYNAGNLPKILNRDEAALAYNGLLLSQTAQDEFGKKLPLALESFGDYKLPGYPYTLALLFKVFPTTDLVVRLPSIIAGTLLILISFCFARNFLPQVLPKKINNEKINRYALLFSFTIATTPVFFFYSRVAFEANLALVIFVSALGLILKKSPTLKTDLLSLSLILLSTLFYNTPLLLLPFIVLGLPFLRGLKKIKNWLPLAIGLSLIFGIMFWQLTSISSQKSSITIFGDETTWHESIAYHNQFSGISQTIFGNKYLFYSKIISKNYLKSFSPLFLVTNGGSHPWHALPGFGHLHWVIYALGILGIIFSFLKIIKSAPNKNRPLIFLIYLLLISLIPAVITIDAPHATRSLLFFWIFSFFAISGFYQLKQVFKLHHLSLLFALIITLESTFYFYNYIASYPQNQPDSLGIGFETTIQEVEKKYPQKNIALVGNEYRYILLAWYLKIPPQEFFATIHKQNPDRIGLKYGDYLTHYHLIAHKEDRSSTETVLVEYDNGIWQVTEF